MVGIGVTGVAASPPWLNCVPFQTPIIGNGSPVGFCRVGNGGSNHPPNVPAAFVPSGSMTSISIVSARRACHSFAASGYFAATASWLASGGRAAAISLERSSAAAATSIA